MRPRSQHQTLYPHSGRLVAPWTNAIGCVADATIVYDPHSRAFTPVGDVDVCAGDGESVLSCWWAGDAHPQFRSIAVTLSRDENEIVSALWDIDVRDTVTSSKAWVGGGGCASIRE